MKKDIEWLTERVLTKIKSAELNVKAHEGVLADDFESRAIAYKKVLKDINQLDEPEQPNITLQDVTDKLWELPLNNRKLWLARLNDEFQEGYIVPLGLKTTDGEEQYLTYNGSYFASRRNRCLQQTFATLEEIPEFYRDLAERVL